MFVTLFLGILTIDSGHVVFINAGHNPPLLVRSNGEVEMLMGGGMVLGFKPDELYVSNETRLEPGDLIYLEDGTGFDVMYKVTETFIVTPDDIWISYDLGKPMMTLFACHPRGSANQRIVVQADLVAGRRIA